MIGVDEVGRGCLAGPLLVVAARQKTDLPLGIADSKLLNRSQRERFLDRLLTSCDFGEGWVEVQEIDGRGLASAMRLGVARALRHLAVHPKNKIILDGPVNYLPKAFKVFDCMIDADKKIPLVSAASIYAKVVRDRFMAELAVKYPGYGFDRHAGYATVGHQTALAKLGPIARVHRFSFHGVGL